METISDNVSDENIDIPDEGVHSKIKADDTKKKIQDIKKNLLENNQKVLKSILTNCDKTSLRRATKANRKKNVGFIDHLRPRIKKPFMNFMINDEENEIDKETINLKSKDLESFKVENQFKNNQKIYKINLASNIIRVFPQDLLKVVSLQEIDLDDNYIKQIPDEISVLKKLKRLSISKNYLRNLPKTLKDLSKTLENLNISFNFIDQIGEEVYQLNNLKNLYINNNNFIQLPTKLYLLKKLEIIALDWFSYTFPMQNVVQSKQNKPNQLKVFMDLCSEYSKTKKLEYIQALDAILLMSDDFENEHDIFKNSELKEQYINNKDKNMNNWLHKAVISQDFGGIRVFHQANTKLINQKNKDGATPLFKAVVQEKLLLTKLLLSLQAQPNIPSSKGFPLHAAASSLKSTICYELIESGAEVNCFDSNGDTPLHLVMANWNKDSQAAQKCIIMLMEAGADPNQLNNNGYAPLHNAVIYNQIKVFKWVLEYNQRINDNQQYNNYHDLSLNVLTDQGMSVIQLAVECGYEDIFSYILLEGLGIDIFAGNILDIDRVYYERELWKGIKLFKKRYKMWSDENYNDDYLFVNTFDNQYDSKLSKNMKNLKLMTMQKTKTVQANTPLLTSEDDIGGGGGNGIQTHIRRSSLLSIKSDKGPQRSVLQLNRSKSIRGNSQNRIDMSSFLNNFDSDLPPDDQDCASVNMTNSNLSLVLFKFSEKNVFNTPKHQNASKPLVVQRKIDLIGLYKEFFTGTSGLSGDAELNLKRSMSIGNKANRQAIIFQKELNKIIQSKPEQISLAEFNKFVRHMIKSIKDETNLISWRLKALNFLKILNIIIRKQYEKLYNNFEIKIVIIRTILGELTKIRKLYENYSEKFNKVEFLDEDEFKDSLYELKNIFQLMRSIIKLLFDSVHTLQTESYQLIYTELLNCISIMGLLPDIHCFEQLINKQNIPTIIKYEIVNFIFKILKLKNDIFTWKSVNPSQVNLVQYKQKKRSIKEGFVMSLLNLNYQPIIIHKDLVDGANSKDINTANDLIQQFDSILLNNEMNLLGRGAGATQGRIHILNDSQLQDISKTQKQFESLS